MTALKQQLWKRKRVLFENQSERRCMQLADIFWWVSFNLRIPFNLYRNVIQNRFSLFYDSIAEKFCLALFLGRELEMCIKGSFEQQTFVCNVLLGTWPDLQARVRAEGAPGRQATEIQAEGPGCLRTVGFGSPKFSR